MVSPLPVWQMVREAISGLGGRATNNELRDFIHTRYGAVNDGTIQAMINTCSVNSPSRVRMPQNAKPRLANTRYDFLFRSDRGVVELYAPERHGYWEIAKHEDGKLFVSRSNDVEFAARSTVGTTSDTQPSDEAGEEFLFPLERHLRDFLVANIRNIRPGGRSLSVYADELGQTGVEYPTGVGFIDLLAVEDGGGFVVFELKLGRGPDAAVGQLARYMGWVKRNLAVDSVVRGIIVAGSVDEKLRYAASVIPDVSLFEYSMSFVLRSADEVEK
jgi:hypothetical protein